MYMHVHTSFASHRISSHVMPHHTVSSGRNRFGSIRFGSGLFDNSPVRFGSVRFGSVRKIQFPGSTRFGLPFSDASWLGPDRFGSFPRPVPAGSRIKRFDSVRPVRFGFLFLPVFYFVLSRAKSAQLKNELVKHKEGGTSPRP